MAKYNIRFNAEGKPDEIIKALESVIIEIRKGIDNEGMPMGLIRSDISEALIKISSKPVKLKVSKDIPLKRSSLPCLKKAYDKALKQEKESFIFDEHEVNTGYAKYLIEYMENYFK